MSSISRRKNNKALSPYEALHGVCASDPIEGNVFLGLIAGLSIKKRQRDGAAVLVVPLRGGLQRLEDSCSPHAGADAHGDHAVFLLATVQSVRQGGHAHGAGGAQGVTQGDGSAQRVDLGRVEAEVLHHKTNRVD